MPFYAALSRYYDEIFPAVSEDMAFIRNRLAGACHLIDLGCGTGNETTLLAERGREVVGVDSAEAMIAIAGERHASVGIRYVRADMEEAVAAYAPGSFDAALCLGNTLVHLTEAGAVKRFTMDVRRILVEGGLFCVQILNYDLILDTALYELPETDTPNVRFRRWYEPSGTLLKFHAELEQKQSGEVWTNSTTLTPLRHDDLDAAFRQGGFGNLEWYGGFAGQPPSDESLVTLVWGTAK